MKKYFIPVVLGFSLLVLMSSCFHDHDVSVSISDDEDEYEMDASFNKNKTHAVRVYLNEHLLNNSRSWRNNRDDEEITLDDNTTIHINTYPGQLSIKIDKTENSEESCEKVRRACEDLKDIIADN